jgi:hypothetical protein
MKKSTMKKKGKTGINHPRKRGIRVSMAHGRAKYTSRENVK